MPSIHPSIPPDLAPHSAVGSGCPSSSPCSPESQDKKVQEKERNEFFQGETAKHQLNPQQGKLWPWELTYIVLHVLFWGSELLVIRAATRWVNQPETEKKSQQSSPVRTRSPEPATHQHRNICHSNIISLSLVRKFSPVISVPRASSVWKSSCTGKLKRGVLLPALLGKGSGQQCKRTHS